ncbi:MAG: hypothetical protein MUP66_03125 [Candidatus Nanohaloarchaeota archaeon QJJ-5]|nr:hypothetical protein [Candidatus Nanohaloarchaeota archaeon QJJ-5]
MNTKKSENTATLVEDIRSIDDPFQIEKETIFQPAFYTDDGANPFDAFHLLMAKDRTISPDKEFDQCGTDRISLEDTT